MFARTPRAETSIDIAADHEVVWQALTTDRGLADWLGDGATIEPAPGGALTAPDPVGGEPRRGRVERVEQTGPNRRLEFTWWPSARPSEPSHVSIRLVPMGRGTRVLVTEVALPAATATTTGPITARAGPPPAVGPAPGFDRRPTMVGPRPALAAPMAPAPDREGGPGARATTTTTAVGSVRTSTAVGSVRTSTAVGSVRTSTAVAGLTMVAAWAWRLAMLCLISTAATARC